MDSGISEKEKKYMLGRWVAKMVARLLKIATLELWVRIPDWEIKSTLALPEYCHHRSNPKYLTGG
jgi:hypothetical protein